MKKKKKLSKEKFGSYIFFSYICNLLKTESYMGFGTWVKAEIYIARKSKQDIEHTLEDERIILNNLEKIFISYCVADPKLLLNPEWASDGDGINSIINKANEILADIYEQSMLIYKMELVLENLDSAVDG